MSRPGWCRCRWAARCLGLAIIASVPASAQQYAFVTDVPADLGSMTRLPSQILDYDFGDVSLVLDLPEAVQIQALARRDEAWFWVPAAPTTVAGTTYVPSQIVKRGQSGAMSVQFDLRALGLADGAAIDALAIGESGLYVVSFDVPVRLQGVDYGPADLVRIEAGLATLELAGPADANVVAASIDDDGTWVIAFDAPTRVSGFDALPGQLIRAAIGSYSLAGAPMTWPAGVQLRGVDLTSSSIAAGSLDDSLRLDHVGSGDVRLDWMPSCAPTDDDYEIYIGSLGDYASHLPAACTTGGATTWTGAPTGQALYFLVVPTNGVREGSYGRRSDGTERPVGLATCRDSEPAVCS